MSSYTDNSLVYLPVNVVSGFLFPNIIMINIICGNK